MTYGMKSWIGITLKKDTMDDNGGATMKTRLLRRMLAIVIELCLCTLLVACNMQSVPPTKADIEKEFYELYDFIEVVNEYLLSLPYDSAFISDARGTYFADFERHKIEDERVKTAVIWLNKYGITFVSKDAEWNSVGVTMWTSSREITCGVVYAIDKNRKPTLQHLTQLEPLSTDGWYYFVEDYNERPID